MGVTLTRHRLYEIDRLVNRTVVYGIVTGLLVAVYVLLVGAFQAALVPATGDSAMAVAAATLLVAAAFGPVRRRVQDAVDRFNRTRYDAVRAATSFRASLRGEVDGEALSRSLREVVTATGEPASVALWLRPRQPDGGALSGSTGYRPRITS